MARGTASSGQVKARRQPERTQEDHNTPRSSPFPNSLQGRPLRLERPVPKPRSSLPPNRPRSRHRSNDRSRLRATILLPPPNTPEHSPALSRRTEPNRPTQQRPEVPPSVPSSPAIAPTDNRATIPGSNTIGRSKGISLSRTASSALTDLPFFDGTRGLDRSFLHVGYGSCQGQRLPPNLRHHLPEGYNFIKGDGHVHGHHFRALPSPALPADAIKDAINAKERTRRRRRSKTSLTRSLS